MSKCLIDGRTARRLAAGSLVAALWLIAGGCGGDRLSTAPVEGKVLYRGEPLEFGSVLFQPEAGPPATGTIGADGSFELSTYSNGDGAVIGKHRVSISCFESQGPNAPPPDPDREPGRGKPLVPRKYLRPETSGLTVEVKQDNEPFEFKLTDERPRRGG